MTNLSQIKENKLKEFDEKFSMFNLNDSAEYNGRIWFAKDLLASFLSQAMDDIQNATIEAGQEEIGKIKWERDTVCTHYQDNCSCRSDEEVKQHNSILSQSYSALESLKIK